MKFPLSVAPGAFKFLNLCILFVLVVLFIYFDIFPANENALI